MLPSWEAVLQACPPPCNWHALAGVLPCSTVACGATALPPPPTGFWRRMAGRQNRSWPMRACSSLRIPPSSGSKARILKAANALIAHNEKLFDKKLWSDLGHGDPITVTVCKDSEKEAESVAMKLQARAESIAKRARAGEDFTALVKEFSDAVPSPSAPPHAAAISTVIRPKPRRNFMRPTLQKPGPARNALVRPLNFSKEPYHE